VNKGYRYLGIWHFPQGDKATLQESTCALRDQSRIKQSKSVTTTTKVVTNKGRVISRSNAR
jgi:hypothetical protein